MQRFFWITVLLASLAVAGKLALKSPARSGSFNTTSSEPALTELTASAKNGPDDPGDSSLLSRYPEQRELVLRLLDLFGHNARRIEASDGINGLSLLDKLGDGAVCLYEERPDEFHQLARVAGADPEAAKLIGAWRPFFDPSKPRQEAAAQLASELSRLSARARRLAEQTPEALPFLLADPKRIAGVLDHFGSDALEPLAYVDLSDGGVSLRRAVSVLDRYGKLAIEATEQLGPAGFLLMERYGSVVEAIHRELGLARSLAVVAAAYEDLDELIERHRTRTVADVILHLENRNLLDVAAGTPNGLRLAVEFGSDGERVLEVVPAGVAVIYGQYAEGRCRNSAVQAISRGGLPAAVAAQKNGDSEKFQRIVARDGPAAILAVASACSAEEARKFLADKPNRTWTESLALTALRLAGDSGDNTIRLIERDGLERVENLSNSNLQIYQFLPLYDLSHLASVVTQGYVPTRGEFAWAGVDATLVAVDVLSLMSLQPEGVAASEAARSGVKSTARATIRTGAESAVGHVTETVAGQATRQVAREGTEQIVQHAAELSSRAAEAASAELAESLARRSGIRLAGWHTQSASRFVAGYFAALPRNRLAKYVAANSVQAGVGLIAVRKMEEYLESRGTSKQSRSGSRF
jgi:hypothetical protein